MAIEAGDVGGGNEATVVGERPLPERVLPPGLIMHADPIRLYLAVNRTPAGEAPPEIREQWIGTLLPMRYARPIERPHPMAGAGLETHAFTAYADAVFITTLDAIAALDRAGRSGAAAYWEHMFHTGRAPGLIFEVAAGRLLPPDLASRIHPGLVEP